MRKRTPKQEAQLGEIQNLSPSDLIRRIGIRGHNDQHYLVFVFFVFLFCFRFEQVLGVVDAAVVELNRRMQILVGKRMLGIRGQPEVARRGDQAVPDTIDYIWDHFYAETVPLSNSEAR